MITGIFLGVLFSLAMAAVAVLAYTSYRQRMESSAANARIVGMLAINKSAMSDLRRDVTSALAAMDANRLHDASIAIQLGAKKLDHAVTTLNRVIFAGGMSAGMDLTGEDLDNMQDVARQQVVSYDTPAQPASGWQRGGTAGYPPPGRFPGVAPDAADPFLAWQQRQQQVADTESGASFPAAPVGPLPDMEAAFAEDLADADVMSDHDIHQVPGMTTKLED